MKCLQSLRGEWPAKPVPNPGQFSPRYRRQSCQSGNEKREAGGGSPRKAEGAEVAPDPGADAEWESAGGRVGGDGEGSPRHPGLSFESGQFPRLLAKDHDWMS